LLNLISHSETRNEDGLVQTLISQFHELACGVQLYPTLAESYREAQKWQVVRDLDVIARETTMTPRPKTSLIKETIEGETIVIKRTASSHHEHVHIQGASDNLPALYSADHFYMYQEHVPALQKHEIRLYIINGNEVVNRVGTATADNGEPLEFWQVSYLRPLSRWNANHG
jgi:hypothetical protein